MKKDSVYVSIIHQTMTDDERKFLFSFKNRNPKWELLGLENVTEVANLPSVQWKLMNLNNMNSIKHQLASEKLSGILFG